MEANSWLSFLYLNLVQYCIISFKNGSLRLSRVVSCCFKLLQNNSFHFLSLFSSWELGGGGGSTDLVLMPRLHVRRKHKYKKPTCKPVRRKHKRLVLALVFMFASFLFRTISILLCLCLCLRRCVVRANRDDASINASVRKGN